MELDELLDREGLDPDELMIWAHRRAERLIAELSSETDELARLLEPAGHIDLDGVVVRRVAVAQDMLPSAVGGAGQVEIEVEAEASITTSIEIGAVSDDESLGDPDAAEVGTRGRRRVPSTPQPLSASELPPPPEHPRLADGEPEPMLDTFDTGPIDLETPEARAMIAANSTRALAVETETETKADASDEFEIDELEELDEEELELLVDVDDSDDDTEAASEAASPPPPPPPPPSRPSQTSAAAPPPAKPADNDVDIDGLIASLADSE